MQSSVIRRMHCLSLSARRTRFHAWYDGHDPQLGLNYVVAEGLIEKTKNPRFVYDSYRRFWADYGDVVMGVQAKGKHDVEPFEAIIEHKKKEKNVTLDTDLTGRSELPRASLQERDQEEHRKGFPEDPEGAVVGVAARCRVRIMEQRTRKCIPQNERYPDLVELL